MLLAKRRRDSTASRITRLRSLSLYSGTGPGRGCIFAAIPRLVTEGPSSPPSPWVQGEGVNSQRAEWVRHPLLDLALSLCLRTLIGCIYDLEKLCSELLGEGNGPTHFAALLGVQQHTHKPPLLFHF